ncbi:unnamed protein product [Caenorhabditis nigoni]
MICVQQPRAISNKITNMCVVLAVGMPSFWRTEDTSGQNTSVRRTKNNLIEIQKKVAVIFEKEQFMSKQSATSYFGTNETHIMWLFYNKRKAVLDEYLAGKISIENLPCQMKILETDYRKCSHWTSRIQVEGLSRMAGVHRNVIYKYFKMRQRMDEKMKAAKSEDISKDPSEIVEPSKLDGPVVLVPDQDDQGSSISPGVGTQQELKDSALTMPDTLTLEPHRDTEYEMEDPASSASSTANVRLVAYKDPDSLVSDMEADESSSLPHGREDQEELDDPIAPGPAMEVVHRQQTHGSQYPEELIEEEFREMQEEDDTIPSHGALPDWDFVFAHMRRKSEDQALIPRADCPEPSTKPVVPSIRSGEVNYPLSPIAQKKLVQDQNYQLQVDLYLAAQEAQKSYLAFISGTQISKKRKRSSPQEILTDEPSREPVSNAFVQVMDHRPSISSDRVEVKRASWISPDALDDMDFASTSYPRSPSPIPQNKFVNDGSKSLLETPRTLSREASTDAFVEYRNQQIHPTLPQPAQQIRSALQTPGNRSPEPQVDEPTPERSDQEVVYHADIAQEQSAEAPANCPQPEAVEESPRLAVLMDPASDAHSGSQDDCPVFSPKPFFSSIQSDEMDYPTSSMPPAPSNSVNPMLESHNQAEGLTKAKGVNEKVIRFFEYFHTRRKMTQKVKKATSGDTSEDPSEAFKTPKLEVPVLPAPTHADQTQSTRPDVATQLEIRNSASPGTAPETEATQPPLHEFCGDIKQEIGDLAPSVPVSEVVHSQQCHGAQNLEDLIDGERYEMEEGKVIPSHGALLDSEFRSALNLQKLLKQTQETLATCHANVAEKQSGEIDCTPVVEAPRISVPAPSHQEELSQQDVRSQARLLADLSLQMTAVQETLAAYMASTPRTQIPIKRKRSSSLEVFTNEPSVSSPAVKRANHQEAGSSDGVEDQRAPEALRGVNEIEALTPERMVQLRQERTKLYGWWFENTYLPFDHSINYKSWTTQQFEEFAIQFLPSDVVTALVKEKVDGSKMEKIRCKNEQLMGRLHVGSNGIFALEHWNLIRETIEEIRAYKIYKKKEEELRNAT